MNYAAEDCPVNRMRDPRRRRLGGADALRALPVPGLRADAGSPADDGRGGRDGGGAPGGLGDTVLGSGRAGMRVSKFDRRICRFLLDGIHDSGGRRPPLSCRTGPRRSDQPAAQGYRRSRVAPVVR